MIRSGNKAINSIYPQTEVQMCIIHQIRNSIKYAASKHHKAFMADLKPVYRAVSKEAVETALDELEKNGRAVSGGASVMAVKMRKRVRLFPLSGKYSQGDLHDKFHRIGASSVQEADKNQRRLPA
ncbi:Uncharacterised protein [Klebsiella oxytoca]|nr:Uncharacterised protein [Klebsiella oxytoca]